MLIFGVLLLLAGLIFNVPVLVTVGVIVAIIGAILLAISYSGRGPRIW